jgi:2-oxoglutarate ferredoxin oxidoreductase subunit alpha
MPYRPYAADNAEAPSFLPLGDERHQVRMTASTHDQDGLLQHSTDDALNNTRRLPAKVRAGTPPLYALEEANDGVDPQALIVTYGITAGAAREAVRILDRKGMPVSLLIAKTLLPIPDAYYRILDRYLGQVVQGSSPEEARSLARVVFAEENVQGQFATMLFGERHPEGVRVVGDIGHMISPEDIVREVRR